MNILILLIVVVVVVLIAYNIGKKSSKKTFVQDNNNYSIRMTTKITTVDDEIEDRDHDNWEGGFWEASDPKAIEAYLEIEYMDGTGNKTERKVRVRKFDNELYNGIMIGHCELRDSTRTFRFDRVKKCTDLLTGEIINNVKKYLNDLYNESPERVKELLLDDYKDLTKVIFYIAKADGQFRQEEKIVIANFIRELINDNRLTNQMIDEVFTKIDQPTIRSFKLAVGKLLKSGEIDPKKLLDVCNRIVTTQETAHYREQEALDYINAKIRSIEIK